MVLPITEHARIENPRGYAADEVENLRQLLATGGPGQPDPRREHFYEMAGNSDTYYIHVSPITGNVVLLAKWSRNRQESCLDAEHMVA